MNESTTTSEAASLPEANLEPMRRAGWAWALPAAALVFVIFLYSQYVVRRGPVIVVELDHGHGLKEGDMLRCRGIQVGEVEQVALGEDLLRVVASIRLEPDASQVAKAGSRFWVVRPTLSLTEVGGLETIAGPHYLAVLPGHGKPQDRFVALPEPPTIIFQDPAGLEIELSADQRGSLTPGAPVTYRQMQIGTVLSVGLASDAASVQVRAYVQPQYVHLVRNSSKFWNVSGANLNLSFKGLRYEVESLAALIKGGVALATPPGEGRVVTTGHRFKLHPKPEDEWLKWRPALLVGSENLPSGARRPSMVRATVSRLKGRIFKRTRQRVGWVLPVAGGLVGPKDLLEAGEAKEQARLEAAGQQFALEGLETKMLASGLMFVRAPLKDVASWQPPSKGVAELAEAEDCLIITDASTTPMPIDAQRLGVSEAGWAIDPAIAFPLDMHGAAVVSRSDGRMVGFLWVHGGEGTVVPVALP